MENVKSKKASDLIVAIGSVRLNVKRRALEEFLRCSQRVNTIAFLQWRKKFPNKVTKVKQLSELINERITFMYGNLKNSLDESKLPSSKLSTDEVFYEDFKPAITPAQSFNIWSF